MLDNPTYEKTLTYAIRIVNLYKYLTDSKAEFVMSKQILRCGTSIGANVSEALAAESSADFIHKLAIAQKETNETEYWLTLLMKTDYISDIQFQSMVQGCVEIRKILASIILTTKSKIRNQKG